MKQGEIRAGKGRPVGRDRDQDDVADACKVLQDKMDILEGLIGVPSARGRPLAGTPAASAPEPYRDAGRALMTAHEGIRRLLAWCKYVGPAGHPGPRMPGSDVVTAEVFRQLPGHAAGLPDGEAVGMVIRYLDRLIWETQGVHGINERNRVRHLRWDGQAEPGTLPPKCPGTCGSYFLVYDEDAGTVACSVYGCEDSRGGPPVADLGTDERGNPMLSWADGRKQVVPGLALAG